MAYRVIVKEEAKQDMLLAYQYYESELPGLGDRFLSALSGRFSALTQHLDHYSFIDSRCILRDIKVNIFPFLIVFEIVGSEVIVYAVCSTHRQSRFWITGSLSRTRKNFSTLDRFALSQSYLYNAAQGKQTNCEIFHKENGFKSEDEPSAHIQLRTTPYRHHTSPYTRRTGSYQRRTSPYRHRTGPYTFFSAVKQIAVYP